MSKLHMWFKKKFEPKPEEIQQMVYDAIYKQTCPVCKENIEDMNHSVSTDKPDFSDSLLTECRNCHAAVYAKLQKVIATCKTYQKDENELFGLKLISETIVDDGEVK